MTDVSGEYYDDDVSLQSSTGGFFQLILHHKNKCQKQKANLKVFYEPTLNWLLRNQGQDFKYEK